MRAGNIRKTFSGEPTAKSLKMLRSCSPLGSANDFNNLQRSQASESLSVRQIYGMSGPERR